MFIGLGIIVMSLVVFQVIVTQRVLNDKAILRHSLNLEQVLSLLDNGELKTYRQHLVGSFSRLNISGMQVHITKGDRFAVYASDYYRGVFNVGVENDELTIRLRGSGHRDLPVFIVMPAEPEYVYINNIGVVGPMHSMLGFSGKGTLLRINHGHWISFLTDMSNLNVRHNNNRLHLHLINSGDIQLFVESEQGIFEMSVHNTNSIDAEIQLIESSLGIVTIDSQIPVGTLSVHGTMRENISAFRGADNLFTSRIVHNGQVDSLHIQLINHSAEARTLILSAELSGRYEHIEVSDNIVIERK